MANEQAMAHRPAHGGPVPSSAKPRADRLIENYAVALQEMKTASPAIITYDVFIARFEAARAALAAAIPAGDGTDATRAVTPASHPHLHRLASDALREHGGRAEHREPVSADASALAGRLEEYLATVDHRRRDTLVSGEETEVADMVTAGDTAALGVHAFLMCWFNGTLKWPGAVAETMIDMLDGWLRERPNRG